MNALEILVTKLRKVDVPLSLSAGTTPISEIAAFNRNIQTLGFTLSPSLINELQNVPSGVVHHLYANLLPILKKMVGAHVKYKPIYPNFPSQVMNMSDSELYIRAIIYYATGLREEFEKEERFPISEEEFKSLVVLDLGTIKDLESIFVSLVKSNGSLSPSDKEVLAWFGENYKIERLLPEVIPNKENMALVCKYLVERNLQISNFVKTITDVLRVAVALCGGDVSLANTTKFKFSRAKRRLILSLLDRTYKPYSQDELKKYKQTWLRLGEAIHPQEYQQYKYANNMFRTLRHEKIVTFNSRVESGFKSGNARYVLSERPGIFARNLDRLLTSGDMINQVLDDYESIVHDVSTPVLMQIIAHFANRDRDFRVFLPKGSDAKIYGVPYNPKPISSKSIEQIINISNNDLYRRFSKLPRLGKCYVDIELCNYPVPFSERSASKALDTVSRGSRIPFNGDIIRMFTYWQEKSDRADLDLSCWMLNDDLSVNGYVTYYNLKEGGYARHSGDKISGSNGACEFVDIEVNKFPTRYAMMQLISYTQQPFCDLTECFAGFMTRKNMQDGEIFEPRTVQNKFDISSNQRICVPIVFDMKYREAIWCDLTLSGTSRTIHGNLSKSQYLLKSVIELKKYSLYELFLLHAQSRGVLVNDRKDADTVFSVDNGITPRNINKILSEFAV